MVSSGRRLDYAGIRNASSHHCGLVFALRRNYRIKYARSWVRKWRARMKFASLENALIAATLVTFAVFVVWSFKIIVGWAWALYAESAERGTSAPRSLPNLKRPVICWTRVPQGAKDVGSRHRTQPRWRLFLLALGARRTFDPASLFLDEASGACRPNLAAHRRSNLLSRSRGMELITETPGVLGDSTPSITGSFLGRWEWRWAQVCSEKG